MVLVNVVPPAPAPALPKPKKRRKKAKPWQHIAVPEPLDPLCPVAQGWATRWPADKPPSIELVNAFLEKHGRSCKLCRRYRRPWRVRARRFRLRINTR